MALQPVGEHLLAAANDSTEDMPRDQRAMPNHGEHVENRLARAEEQLDAIDSRFDGIERRIDAESVRNATAMRELSDRVVSMHRDMVQSRSVNWGLIASVSAVGIAGVTLVVGVMTTLGVMALAPIRQTVDQGQAYLHERADMNRSGLLEMDTKLQNEMQLMHRTTDEKIQNIADTVDRDAQFWVKLREAQFELVNKSLAETRARLIDVEQRTNRHLEESAERNARQDETLRWLSKGAAAP